MAKTKPSTNSNARRKAVKIAKARGPADPPAAPATGRARETKQAVVLGGASLAELVVATGWLPHTTRAALTRLRQGGHDLQKEKRDTGETAYRIEPARVARARKAA